MLLQVGQTITAPFLPGPAEIKQFESRRGYYRLEVLLQDGSNQYFSRNIFDHQLDQITVLDHNAAVIMPLSWLPTPRTSSI